MPQLLQYFILLPLGFFLLSLFMPRKNEKLLSRLVIGAAGLHLIGVTLFIVFWLFNGYPVLDSKHFVFFKSDSIEIFIDFYFDGATAVYALVGSLLNFLVTIFSRFYIHREAGFKRFFVTILLFFLGYNFVIFSGNFETLFIGWEILGICSFLLIAFYRDRYLPVKNGLKTISVYRLGDMCLILVMWMSHQLWHENITFLKLNDVSQAGSHLSAHPGSVLFIALMLVFAASTKSAQLPFSSWLPRAMEGPTSSSAIFYGSLSVHLGMFLLIRTYTYWEGLLPIKVLIIIIGLATSIIATGIAKVQGTVKTQIAYSSIAQIGIMFIEVALGWHVLALIHFAGNAFLRTYQLLVSPSVLNYLIHDMFYHYKKPEPPIDSTSLSARLRNSFYILSVREWNLDRWMYKILWSPFKWTGKQLDFLSNHLVLFVVAVLWLVGLYADIFPEDLPKTLLDVLPVVFAFIGLLFILHSFTERKNARRAWLFVLVAQLYITLSIALFHIDFGHQYMLIYLGGSLVSAIVGWLCLNRIINKEKGTDLDRFYGHIYEYRWEGFVFLIACLGMIGFPFTPSFIGIDLIFSHIGQQEILLIVPVAISFIIMELAILRIYARVFLGPHIKTYHPIAYRSS